MIKKILVSQPQPTTDRYFEIASKYGVEFVFRPFIKVEKVSTKEFRAQHIDVSAYTAVIFTSRHAIDNYFAICKEMRFNVPEQMKYFCVTEQIALYIQKYVQYRKRKIFFPETGKFADMMPVIIKHKNEKYLIPISEQHNDEIANMLEEKKLTHAEAVMYRTVSNDFTAEEKFDFDMMVFFSPSGVQALLKNFPNFKQDNIAIATFGPTTAKAVKDAGLRLDVEAPSPQYPSITSALEAYLKEHCK